MMCHPKERAGLNYFFTEADDISFLVRLQVSRGHNSPIGARFIKARLETISLVSSKKLSQVEELILLPRAIRLLT